MREGQHFPKSETLDRDPKIEKAKEILAGFNVSYREEEAPIENYYRGKVLQKLQEIGVILVTEKGLVFDKNKFANSEESKRRVDLGRSAIKRRLDILDYTKALDGVEIIDNSEKDQNDKKPTRPIMALPKNLKELETGEYQRNSSKAMIQPWEIGKQFNGWKNEIPMADGEKLTFSELAMVQALAKVQARRNKKGELEIHDEEKKDFVKFSGTSMKKVLGGSIGGSSENIYMNSLLFAKNQLPNLLRIGIIKESDFRTTADSSAAKIYNVHERRLSKTSGNVSFSNTSGQSAQYFVGKEKLVGIGMKIDHEHMTARMLDRQNVAIVKDEKGEKTIVATFPLLREEQLSKIQDAVKERLLERGVDPTPTNVTSYTTIGGKQMKNLLREYSVTDFLKARPGENPADYYKRLKPLDNPDFVLGKVTGFFQKAGIGIHNLPWSEQLVLARALLVETDEQKLLGHAKKYGLPGVRAFLSMDYDNSLGQKIVNIGDRLNSHLGDALFKKYGEIVDAAYQAADYIRDHFPAQDEFKNHSSQKLAEQLLKKGKDLLAEFADSSGQKGSEYESVKLVQKLEQLKTEVLMFAASYKILPKEAKVEFEDIANTSIEDRDSASLTEEEKRQMEEIFTLNRLGNYPEKLLKQTQKDFAETLNTSGHTFRMLVHQGRLVAFLHYDQTSEYEIYVGSLNLHPSAKDSPIAIAMLKAALEEKGGENKLKAIVWQNNPAGRFYKMLGFKETGQIENYENTGEIYLQLERPPSQGTQIHEIKKAA